MPNCEQSPARIYHLIYFKFKIRDIHPFEILEETREERALPHLPILCRKLGMADKRNIIN